MPVLVLVLAVLGAEEADLVPLELDADGVEEAPVEVVFLVVLELDDEEALFEDVPVDAVAFVELEAAGELVVFPEEPDAFVEVEADAVLLLEDVPVDVAVFAEPALELCSFVVLDAAGFVVEVFGTATVFSLGGFGFSRV